MASAYMRSIGSGPCCTSGRNVELAPLHVRAARRPYRSSVVKTTGISSKYARQQQHLQKLVPKVSNSESQQHATQSCTQTVTASQTGSVGVVLLNLGGPDTLDDVQPFLYNLFVDPDIIRLPKPLRFLQPLLAAFISVVRAPKSAEGYKSIGGGSPLRRITEEQADELSKALHAKGLPANVYVAMRYWHPFTEAALDQVKRDKVDKLVILPLYPQFSISTTGSSVRAIEATLKKDPKLANLAHTVVPTWYKRAGYVKAMADLICAELDKFGNVPSVEIFFSAHGVPKSYVEKAGDPYKQEMEHCVQLIMEEVKLRGYGNHHTLAYQSRVGPVEWLRPYTDDTIKALGKSGVKSLLAVPISFVSEHIETLEEIDMEYRELAHESGIANWGRVPALNCNQVFIDDLADAVIEALPTVAPMCSSPAQPASSSGSGNGAAWCCCQRFQHSLVCAAACPQRGGACTKQ